MPAGCVPCAPNLQLAVELTDAGRAVAQPLLLAEQDRLRAEQRAAEVVVLPLVPAAGLPADGTSALIWRAAERHNIRPAVGILWCVSTAHLSAVME